MIIRNVLNYQYPQHDTWTGERERAHVVLDMLRAEDSVRSPGALLPIREKQRVVSVRLLKVLHQLSGHSVPDLLLRGLGGGICGNVYS